LGLFSRSDEFFGLDIGSTTLKLVQLKASSGKPLLVTYGTASIPIGLSQSDSDIDIRRLSEVIRQLVKGTRATTKNVSTALPENQVFTLVLPFPQMSPADLKKAVQWQVQQNLPMNIEDVRYDWQVISVPKNANEQVQVMITAAPIERVRRINRIIAEAGLNLVGLETTNIALSRSLATFPGAKILIVDIGAMSTELAIVENHIVLHSRSISFGGEAFTRAISNTLGLDLAQADQFKCKFGVTLEKLEGRVYKAIKPILATIVDEIIKSMQFFENQFGSRVDLFIISGGSAKMPEIGTFFAKTFNMDVQIANPWKNIAYPVSVQEDIINNAPDYSTVIGLALREVK